MSCEGIRMIGAWGRTITEKISLPLPACAGDATTTIPEPPEYLFELPAFPGMDIFFEVV